MGFSLVVAQAPERVGSIVVVPGLSYLAACGILVPQPGIEPTSPALEGGFLTTGPPAKSPEYCFLTFTFRDVSLFDSVESYAPSP